MRGHWLLTDVWKLEYDCSQLFFSERGDKEVLIGDVRSDVLLGTEFSHLGKCDESQLELNSEDMFG